MTKNELSDADIQDAVDAARSEVKYQVTDFPVEMLIQRFREDNPDEGDIYIPDYQRTLQWTPDQKSYFIESIILRIPIPPLFFYETKGRLEVVDGSQRIRTLVDFYLGRFKLTNLEKLDSLNGLKFNTLPSVIKKRLANSPIRSFVLEEGTDETARVELFRRINTSAKQLTDAEIRKGAYQGPFLELVIDCANRKTFQELAPGTGSRSNKNAESERQELVARFFIYSAHYQSFTHDVRRFIDGHFKNFNKFLKPDELALMSDEFDQVMGYIKQHAPHAFFRSPKTRQVPRVRFEAVSVGTCLALRQMPHLTHADYSWLEGDEFYQMVRTDASNSGPRLRSRVEYVRDRLVAQA